MSTKHTRDKGKEGFWMEGDNFYWGSRNITGVWMEFFSHLHMNEEKDCVEIFRKFYPKYLKLETKFTKDYNKLLETVRHV